MPRTLFLKRDLEPVELGPYFLIVILDVTCQKAYFLYTFYASLFAVWGCLTSVTVSSLNCALHGDLESFAKGAICKR